MPDLHELARAMSEGVRAQLQGYDVGQVLDRLTLDVATVLGVHGAGVNLGDDGTLRFVTASNERVMRLEMHQEQAQEGACQDAFASGEVVTAADVRAEGERWPTFAPHAAELGFRAVAGLPMGSHGQRIGALNLYHDEPRVWSNEDLETAQLLADLASLHVIGQLELGQARTLAEQLQHALESRVVIEQAKGIVAERKGIDLGGAFGLIRQHARTSQTKIHKVAQAIIDGELNL